jgi:mannose-6-phosphate isomerase-like protein (cupin superfamily)
MDGVKMAVAKGATLFEKHVGVPTDHFQLNAYSATPEQVRSWLESARQAFDMCGVAGKRPEFSKEEIASLHSLRRGVYAKRLIEKGERIRLADVFTAIPTLEGHVTANDLSKYTEFHATISIAPNAPLLISNTAKQDVREKVYDIVQRVKELVKKSAVTIPPKADLEISHHYGIDRFDEYGLTMLTVVNREYCKKLIILLPRQKHPEQYHKAKEETFHILHGDVWVNLAGKVMQCRAGEVITVERGMIHSFGTDSGAIIEEISSTHLADDSYYVDSSIMQNQYRKTLLTYWFD